MKRVTAKEFRQSGAAKNGNKYKAQPVTVDGIRFDSKKEARRYGQLKLMQQAGEISDLEVHKRVYMRGERDLLRKPNGLPMSTVIDFAYTERGRPILEDAKGMRTRDWAVRVAVLGAMGLTVREF